MNNQVIQTENKAYVLGKLKSKDIEFKTSSNGRLMATGNVVLVVKNEFGVGEVKVKVMQFATKKDGSENGLYKGLVTVSNTYKAIDEVGEELADTIKIEGSIEDNFYYSPNKGDMVEMLQIKALFINRVDGESAHYCKVAFGGLLKSVTPVQDELEVEIIGIGYEGVAVPFKATVPAHLVAPFQAQYTPGCTATFNIHIVNAVEVTIVQETVAFGESIGETIERTINKKMIFGASSPLFTGVAGSVSQESANQGIALRNNKLEKKRQEGLAKQGDNVELSVGFGTPQNANAGFNGATFGGVQGATFGAFPGVK